VHLQTETFTTLRADVTRLPIELGDVFAGGSGLTPIAVALPICKTLEEGLKAGMNGTACRQTPGLRSGVADGQGPLGGTGA
jgi:hypothetical protein